MLRLIKKPLVDDKLSTVFKIKSNVFSSEFFGAHKKGCKIYMAKITLKTCVLKQIPSDVLRAQTRLNKFIMK